jgi:hypothetical protein
MTFKQTLDREIADTEKVMEDLAESKEPSERTRFFILQGHKSGLSRAKLLLVDWPNPFGPNKAPQTDTLYGKLLPCPFCGAPAEMDTRRAYRDMATGKLDTAMAIYCTQCTAEKSMCLKDFRGLTTDEIAADLITGWNRRAEQ